MNNYLSSPHPGIQSLNPYVPGESPDVIKQEFNLKNIIKLASNENPLGCSTKVIEYLKHIDTKTISIYPAPDHHPIVKKLSQRLNIEPNNLIFGNGSDQLFQLMLITYGLHQKKSILIPKYSFIAYSIQAQILGIPIIYTPVKENFDIDIDAIIKQSHNDAAIIFIANPNNPTGNFIEPDQILYLLQHIPPEVLLVIDEAYFEYSIKLDSNININLQNKYPNLIITRTFSKAYGLAGLRIGYLIANQIIINNLKRVLLPFSTNNIALDAANIALDDQTFINNTLSSNQLGKAQLQNSFQKLQLTYLESKANFISVNFKKNAMDVYNALLKKGIIVRPLKAYNLDNYLRITIGTKSQNDALIRQLQLLLKRNTNAFK